MKKVKFPICVLTIATCLAFQSCESDNDDCFDLRYPNALVTVCPLNDGGFEMILDDVTRLYPANMSSSPFENKEVRALVNYTPATSQAYDDRQYVNINWIDSIRTKYPTPYIDPANAETYGNDPVEIIKSWVTVAEDGYLTLRLNTLWGPGTAIHRINLLSGVNPDNPFEFELRHDAQGDVAGRFRDALIAFNLNELPRTSDQPVKIKLRWNSFSGTKTAEFDLTLRPKIDNNNSDNLVSAAQLK